jgi:hypothetical protein
MLRGDAPHELGLYASCPICGERVDSMSNSDWVLAEDLRPVPLHRRWGRSEIYGLCDECTVLAHLPAHATLN